MKEIVGFTVEDDGLGEHAVTGAVLGGYLFAFGGDGASGAGAVDASGFGFEFGGHIGDGIGGGFARNEGLDAEDVEGRRETG